MAGQSRGLTCKIHDLEIGGSNPSPATNLLIKNKNSLIEAKNLTNYCLIIRRLKNQIVRVKLKIMPFFIKNRERHFYFKKFNIYIKRENKWQVIVF